MATVEMQSQETNGLVRSQASKVGRKKLTGGEKRDIEF